MSEMIANVKHDIDQIGELSDLRKFIGAIASNELYDGMVETIVANQKSLVCLPVGAGMWNIAALIALHHLCYATEMKDVLFVNYTKFTCAQVSSILQTRVATLPSCLGLREFDVAKFDHATVHYYDVIDDVIRVTTKQKMLSIPASKLQSTGLIIAEYYRRDSRLRKFQESSHKVILFSNQTTDTVSGFAKWEMKV